MRKRGGRPQYQRTWGKSWLESVGGVHGDDEGTITGGDLLRVVPLEITSGAIPDIHGLPKGIVAGVKRATGSGELVGKDESIVGAIEARTGEGLVGSVGVDEVGHVEENGGLAGAIDADIASDLGIYLFVLVESDNGVADEEGEETEEKEEDDGDIDDATPGEGVIVGMVRTMVVEEVVVVGGVELVLGGVIGVRDEAVFISTWNA